MADGASQAAFHPDIATRWGNEQGASCGWITRTQSFYITILVRALRSDDRHMESAYLRQASVEQAAGDASKLHVGRQHGGARLQCCWVAFWLCAHAPREIAKLVTAALRAVGLQQGEAGTARKSYLLS